MKLFTNNNPHSGDTGNNLSRWWSLWLVPLGASFLLAYFHIIQGLIRVWANSDEYSHGFFIVPIAAYIIWKKKEQIARVPLKSSWAGLVVVVFSLLLYILSHFAEILTATSFSMVLFIVGVVLFLCGKQVLKELSFPLFLLLLMIPIPSQVYSMATIPLQLLVSQLSVMAASVLGVPVFREGNVIHLSTRTLEVVQACSGLRSLITLSTLGILIAYFTLQSNLLRILLLMSVVPVAILVNIFRVLVMILAFQYFHFDLTTDATHTAYGIVIFILAMAILIGIKGILSVWDISKSQK